MAYTTACTTVQAAIKFHMRNASSSRVNGEIAFLWEWSKFCFSLNSSPLFDDNKTLRSTEHVIKSLCKSVVKERLKYKTSFKIFILICFLGLAYVSRWILMQTGLKHAESRKDVPSLGFYRWLCTYLVSDSRQNLAWSCTFKLGTCVEHPSGITWHDSNV